MNRQAAEDIARRVAYIYVTQQTSSLAYIRRVLSTTDVDLSRKFRDAVVELIRKRARGIDPGNPFPPRVHLDGNRKLHINLFKSGDHRAMLFVVELPAAMFQQFVHDPRPPSITESFSASSIDTPDIAGLKNASEVAEAYIRHLADVVKSGDLKQAPHSGVPVPLER